MKKIKEIINIVDILTLFILIQPIIDLITSITVRFNLSSITIGIVVRTIIMIISGIYVIFKIPNTKLKKLTLGYFGIFGLYIIAFLINSIYYKGIGALFAECKGIIKTFYLPFMTISYINIYMAKNKKIENKILNNIFLAYSILLFLPTCLGIYCYSYHNEYNGYGTIGLFYSANEIGGILGILLIYTLNKFLEEEIDVKNLLSMQLLLFSVLYIGTKVPVLSLALAILYLILINIIREVMDKENKNIYRKKVKKLLLLVCCIVSLAATTPFAKNFISLNDKFIDMQSEINVKVENDENLENKKLNKERLKKYTETMTSGRTKLLKDAKLKYNNSSKITKLLGYGYVDNLNNKYQIIKTVEIDYFDILFSQGVIGMCIFFIPIIYFALVCIRILFTNFKKCILNNNTIYLDIFSICLGLSISLAAGHIITAPSVNIYLTVAITRLFLAMKKIENKY